MDVDRAHTTDRFTKLMIFSSDYDFPAFASKFLINYKTVMGYYKGNIEEGYVVNMHNTNTILAGGMLKGQETVLILEPQEAVFGGQRDVYLVKVSSDGYKLDPDGEFIGKWHKVNASEALHSDAWTCYPEDNLWYVAKMMEQELLSDL